MNLKEVNSQLSFVHSGLRHRPGRTVLLLVIFVIIAVAGLFFLGYFGEMGRRVASAGNSPSRKEPTSTPQSTERVTATPPPSQVSRVASQRVFAKRTPRELLALYEGRTILQADSLVEPYKGLWILVQAETLMVIPDTAGVTLILTSDGLINARFDPSSTVKKLNRL